MNETLGYSELTSWLSAQVDIDVNAATLPVQLREALFKRRLLDVCVQFLQSEVDMDRVLAGEVTTLLGDLYLGRLSDGSRL